MKALLQTLLRSRRLLKDFVGRDLKARYVGSSMGFFWSVVYPIINLFVYMFVFRVVLKARWSDRQGELEVALVMLAGIVVWTAFAETISRSTNTLVDNANLIQKVVFPAEILPSYLTLSSLINMCIGIPVVLACVGWFAFFSPPLAYLEVPYERVEEGRETRWEPVDVRLGERDSPYEIRLGLTRGFRRRVSVPLTISGTATRGRDYRFDVDEAVFPRGDQTMFVIFTPLPDAEREGDETIIIELGDPDGARLVRPGEKGIHAGTRLEITLVDGDPALDAEPPPVAATPSVRFQPPVDRYDPTEYYYRPLDLGLTLISLPVLLVLQFFFTVGLGYFLSTLNLFLRDTFHLVGVGITVWMFSTPIFYPATMVAKADLSIVLELNPMHWMIECYRAVLLHNAWPDPFLLVKLAGAAVVCFALGGAFFVAQKPKFPDLL